MILVIVSMLWSTTAFTDVNAEEILFGCGYEYTANKIGDQTVIKFQPHFTGSAGDGFLVSTYDFETAPGMALVIDYFLPEGQPLVLENKRYEFWTSRAFRTDKGLVSGNEKIFNLNLEMGSTAIRNFDLEKYEGNIITVYNPTLSVNFDKRVFTVKPFTFAPNETDLIYVQLSAGYHIPLFTERFISAYGGDIYPPTGYSAIAVANIYKDALNNRLIRSEFEWIRFSSTIPQVRRKR
jgi:hypothetical protein